MSNIVRYKGTKTNAVEIDATVTNAIDISGSTVTNAIKFADGQACSATAFTNDTVGTTPEDGFIKIDVGGTTYKIPFWADD